MVSAPMTMVPPTLGVFWRTLLVPAGVVPLTDMVWDRLRFTLVGFLGTVSVVVEGLDSNKDSWED